MRIGSFAIVLLAAALGACAAPSEEEAPAEASGEALTNDVLHAALVAGKIGETATGYLAIVEPAKASDELRRNLADNTIKRRALYTQIAEKFVWTTVQDVAKQAACNVFKDNVLDGYTYQTEDGTWTKRTAKSPVIMPSWCSK